MAFEIEGKTALVTGGNRGIGRSIVERFLQDGATRVWVAVRDPSSADDLVQRYGGRIQALRLDLGKADTITAAASIATDVQLVVNNAGVLKNSGPLSDDVLESLDFEFNINVKGLIRMARAFAPVLAANGGGAFVQLNSIASLRSVADFATYCASKAAAYSITQALRDVLAGQGTQVVSVHPGPIATDMAKDAGIYDKAESPEVVAEAIVDALQQERFHAFPDTMARELWEQYASFAEAVVESDVSIT